MITKELGSFTLGEESSKFMVLKIEKGELQMHIIINERQWSSG